MPTEQTQSKFQWNSLPTNLSTILIRVARAQWTCCRNIDQGNDDSKYQGYIELSTPPESANPKNKKSHNPDY